MFRYIIALLSPIPDDKDLTASQIITMLRKRGYTKDDESFVMKIGWGYSNTVTLREDGLSVKARMPGYGESGYISFPITKSKLKEFLKENEV